VILSLDIVMLAQEQRDAGLCLGAIARSRQSAVAFGAGRIGRFHRFHQR
jgi:hypothetical protein